MTHYEERLEEDLTQIRAATARIAEDVQDALKESVHALLAGDADRAYGVVLGDHPINRAVRASDRRCHAFVARHLPSAGHLRFVSATLRLNIELERIGDYAVAIARESVQLSAPPSAAIARDIELIAERTHRVLGEAVRSFLEGNAELARATKKSAYDVEHIYENVFNDLLAEGERRERPLKDLFALLVVYNRIGRVADQAKNICEDTVFAVTGATKAPKVYKVLFVDEHNDCASQIAEQIGRKAFSNSGEFDSAAWDPADKLSPTLLGFMERRGHTLELAVASSMATTVHELNDYHVVVSLNGEVREHIDELPFATIFLRWNVGDCPADMSDSDAEEKLDDIYRELAGRVEDLMETLRGEDAD
ncbi:MAG: PhoU domain-containing protein [Acidobacteriota bacterium]|jgi:phosphate transport system protein